MESELFTYDGWDGDPECMIYYQPLLTVDIGAYPMGTRFDSACICHDKGILEFYGDSGEIPAVRFRLHYRVGEPLPID